MNFKDWEKLSEDGRTVTLKHPKGHTMMIALKGLPKIQQEQLKRLQFAKGGKVEDEDDGMSEQGKTVRHAKKMKERGEDSSVEDHDAKEEAKGRAKFEKTIKPKIKGLADGGRVARYEGGTPDEPVSQDDAAGGTSPQPQAPATVINIGTPQGAPVAPAPQPMGRAALAPVSQAEPMAPPEPKMVEPKQAISGGNQGEAQNTLQSIENQKAAVQNQGAIEASKAQAVMPAAQEALKTEQALAQQNQNALKEVGQHTQEFNDWMTRESKEPGSGGIINPRHYQESMSTGQKVNTAIGLFLGGLGTPFGGHNYAFDHLQSQIDRDIHAQQQNVDNRKSVLGAWQQLYGDNNISTNLAKASMNDIYAKKIQMAAAQVGTKQAAVNAQMATSKLMQDSTQLRTEAAGQLGAMRASGQNPKGSAQAPQGAGAKNEGVKPSVGSILKPNAEAMIQQAAKYNPQYKERAPELYAQLKQAQKIDALLNGPEGDGKGGIKELMQQMHSSVGNGKTEWNASANHVRRTMEDSLDRIPYVGTAVKSYVDMSHKDSDYQSYESARGALKSDLATALAGLIPPSEIDGMIEANLPQYKDSPEDVKRKEQFIVNTLKKTAVFPDLDLVGATVKGRR